MILRKVPELRYAAGKPLDMSGKSEQYLCAQQPSCPDYPKNLSQGFQLFSGVRLGLGILENMVSISSLLGPSLTDFEKLLF